VVLLWFPNGLWGSHPLGHHLELNSGDVFPFFHLSFPPSPRPSSFPPEGRAAMGKGGGIWVWVSRKRNPNPNSHGGLVGREATHQPTIGREGAPLPPSRFGPFCFPFFPSSYNFFLQKNFFKNPLLY